MNFLPFKEKKKSTIKKKIFYTFLGLFLTSILTILIIFYFALGNFKMFFGDFTKFLGFFGEKNYLILLQNNSEKRPTGGFISSFIHLKSNFGFLDFKIKDSYDINPPKKQLEPPYPMNKLFSKDKFYKGWVFRDANFHPNLEKSSKKIIEFYKNGTDFKGKIDGVIFLDFAILKSFFKVYGEIFSLGETFTKNNFFYKMQFLSKNIDLHNIEQLDKRKDFFKDFFDKFFEKIYKNPSKFLFFRNEIFDLIQKKHLQVYFEDEILQKKFEDFSGNSNFKNLGENFLHINITNIGGRKADRYIKNSYFFEEDFSGKENIGSLEIKSKHLGTKSLISDFYQAYFKIFLAKDFEIISVKGDFKDKHKISSEGEFKTIGGLVHMNPGETFSLKIDFKLPKNINTKDFKLKIIPQAGSEGENFSITIKEKTDNFLEGKDFEIKENVGFFDGKIFKNKVFKLKNIGDKFAPISVWQRFVEKDLIEINFSEEINQDFLHNLENFSIKDLNKKNNSFEKLTISKAYLKGNSLFLKVKNISFQKGEHYLLEIYGIKDLAGNFKVSKFFTIVQNLLEK